VANLEDFSLEFENAGWPGGVHQVAAFLALEENRHLLSNTNVEKAALALRIHPDVWDGVRYSDPFKVLMGEYLAIATVGYLGWVEVIQNMHKIATGEDHKLVATAARFLKEVLRMVRPQEIKVLNDSTFRIVPAQAVDVPILAGASRATGDNKPN
jgi:hypothetical protein